MRKKLAGIILCFGMTISLITNVKADEYNTGMLEKDNEYSIGYYENTVYYSSSSSSSSGSDLWYYNTGTSLPKIPNYKKYGLTSIVKKGDILYEANGGFGITGHIAIVEGIFYDESKKKSYIRVIEAIDNGVVRSVLDADRIDDRAGTIYRVSSATSSQKTAAIDFCISQLGKKYVLDFQKDTSANEKDWYCSELVWAAYKRQGIDIEDTGLNEPGITPRDIIRSNKTKKISFK